MSDRDGPTENEQAEDRAASVSNPFDEGGQAVDDRPQLNLSKRRAAVMGLSFGLLMVGLLVVCFLLSVALASCAD